MFRRYSVKALFFLFVRNGLNCYQLIFEDSNRVPVTGEMLEIAFRKNDKEISCAAVYGTDGELRSLSTSVSDLLPADGERVTVLFNQAKPLPSDKTSSETGGQIIDPDGLYK